MPVDHDNEFHEQHKKRNDEEHKGKTGVPARCPIQIPFGVPYKASKEKIWESDIGRYHVSRILIHEDQVDYRPAYDGTYSQGEDYCS